jgi:starch-binding outer membrane protein, SusD/RagB family
MKRNLIKIVLTAGLLAVSITSCRRNLILTPNNELTSQQVFTTPAGYTDAMAKVYGSFALTGNIGGSGSGDIAGIDEGTSDFWRLYWNCEELTTDEAVITYGDPGVQDLHNMVWSASNAISQGLYYRSLYQITLCNNFIQQSTDDLLASRGITGADATNIRFYRAEARFLRAYQYWVLMDIFGDPPFVTDATPIGSVIPPQTTRTALFAYIESELKAIDGLLQPPNKNLYGRADQGAEWALLARMYLNAQIYTGTARYTDAITYAQKVITSGAYVMIPKFINLMLADDNINSGSVQSGGGATGEFIFTINYDGIKTQGYGGSQYLTHAPVGGSMPVTSFGISGGYAGSRTTANIIALFPTPPTTDATNFPNNNNPDTRAEFWYPGQNLVINNVTSFTDGLGVNKFRNVTSTGAQGSSPTYADVDLPLFRLPEQYLIYAEAVLRGGTGGDAATALNYFNLIRTRAYGNATGNISAAQLTLQIILDERARELFWEGFRRTDLIRYGQFTGSSYLWPFKGGVKAGAAVPDYRQLFPIPSLDQTANPNLIQNPGY